MSPIDAIHWELADRGLPRSYLLRVRGELAAHVEDAITDLIEAGHPITLARSIALERFGDPSILAAAFVERHRRSSFIARHPLGIAFAAPPLMFIALGTVHLVAFVMLYCYFSSWSFQTAQHVGQALVSLSGASLAVLMLRHHLGHWRWSVIAMLIFAVLGMTSDLSVRPEPNGNLAMSMYVARCLWRSPYYLFFMRGISTRTPSGSISFHSWRWHKERANSSSK
jgi:hypothetical protein